MTTTTNPFALATTAEILASVNADGENYAPALDTLARRCLRAKPRAQALDGFAKLIESDAGARPSGSAEDYVAWRERVRAEAAAYLGEDAPAKVARKASPKAKAPAKGKATRKAATRKASPKAKGASPEAKVAEALKGVDADTLKAMATFFAKLG